MLSTPHALQPRRIKLRLPREEASVVENVAVGVVVEILIQELYFHLAMQARQHSEILFGIIHGHFLTIRHIHFSRSVDLLVRQFIGRHLQKYVVVTVCNESESNRHGSCPHPQHSCDRKHKCPYNASADKSTTAHIISPESRQKRIDQAYSS